MTKESKFHIKRLAAFSQDLIDEIEVDFASLNQKLVRLNLVHQQINETLKTDLDSRKDDEIDTLFQVNSDAKRN